MEPSRLRGVDHGATFCTRRRSTARRHVASDFPVGTHATTADASLTVDEGFFREYVDVDCRSIRAE